MQQGKKIKVLEAIRQGKIGGGESYLLSLVENMDKSMFEPVVLSFTDGPMVTRLRELGIKTYVIYTEKPFDIRVWGKVKRLIKEEQIDIVHAHGTRANSNLFWAAKKMKLPIIYTCHAWSFHIDQHPVVKKMRIWSEGFLTSRMDVNICGSIANKETARKLFKHFDAEVINNSIDPVRFNPCGSYKDVRAELGIDKNEIIVASVARFTLQKQPLRLINAFAEVVKKIDNVKLLMVGDGELKKKAIDLINALNLQEKVILQPFRQDVPDVLAAADIFVLPSLWEAFPIALLEAMSMGKAVVATNVDGTPEMVTHNDNGLLISLRSMEKELEESLVKLCMEKELRRKLQQRAVETIYNRYNADILARKNEAIYHKLYKSS